MATEASVRAGIQSTVKALFDVEPAKFDSLYQALGDPGTSAPFDTITLGGSQPLLVGTAWAPPVDPGSPASSGPNTDLRGNLQLSQVVRELLAQPFTAATLVKSGEPGVVLAPPPGGLRVLRSDGTWGNANGLDGDAIHDNVANEFLPIAAKTTPVAADLLLVEDSADSGNKKSMTAGNLVNLTNAYDFGPILQLNSTDGQVVIRDAASTIGTLFDIDDSGSTRRYLRVASTAAQQLEIGSHSAVISGAHEPIMYIADAANSLQWWPTDRTFTSSPGAFMRSTFGVVHTHDYVNVSFAAFNLQHEMRHNQAGFVFNHGLIFNHAIQYRNVNGVAVNFGPIQGFIDQPNVAADGASISAGLMRSFLSQPNYNTLNGGALSIPSFGNFQAFGQLNTGITMTERRGLQVGDMGGTGGTLTTQYGVDIEALARGTTNVALRIQQAVGTAIQATGIAPSTFAGDVHMNDGISLVLGSVGSDGAELFRSGPGTFTMGGVGGAFNEQLDWNFNATNNVRVTSPSGASLNFNTIEFAFGPGLTADGTNNWVMAFAPGLRGTNLAGDYSEVLFSSSSAIAVADAITDFSTWAILAPSISLTGGSIVDAANVIIRTNMSQGTNRYGLLVRSSPSGGTLNYCARFLGSAGVRIDGILEHTGSTAGLYGATPVVQAAAYSVSNATPLRTFDVTTATLTDALNVLAALIADSQGIGIAA